MEGHRCHSLKIVLVLHWGHTSHEQVSASDSYLCSRTPWWVFWSFLWLHESQTLLPNFLSPSLLPGVWLASQSDALPAYPDFFLIAFYVGIFLIKSLHILLGIFFLEDWHESVCLILLCWLSLTKKTHIQTCTPHVSTEVSPNKSFFKIPVN